MQIMIHKKLVIIAFSYTTVYKSFEKFMYLFYKKIDQTDNNIQSKSPKVQSLQETW